MQTTCFNRYDVPCPVRIHPDSNGQAIVPGSKSITNRALLLAAMAGGTSTLKGCLTSDDARHFLECLQTLGFPVSIVPDGLLGSDITITGFGGTIPSKTATLYVGSAGTAARFLAAMLAFSDGEYTLTSSEQMQKRPMQPLIDCLRAAGAQVVCLQEEGHFPLHIIGARRGNQIPRRFSVNIDQSSQFLSALLIAAGTLGQPSVIQVTGSHGLSYVDLTVSMMQGFGVPVQKITQDGQLQYQISGGDAYRPLDYAIEPDMSAAAYFYALAAVLGTRVTVKGVHSDSRQGDIQFLDVLEQMGCRIERYQNDAQNDVQNDVKNDVLVVGPSGGHLRGGFTVPMASFSDQTLTLAAIAPYADAPITIAGIGHIRLQECDRIDAILLNLRALGVRAEASADAVTIYPGAPVGCPLETFDDHRVAMSFALTGLRAPGTQILNPGCCRKTFAEYFQVLDLVLSQLERN